MKEGVFYNFILSFEVRRDIPLWWTAIQTDWWNVDEDNRKLMWETFFLSALSTPCAFHKICSPFLRKHKGKKWDGFEANEQFCIDIYV